MAAERGKASPAARRIRNARAAMVEATFALGINLALVRERAGNDRRFIRWCKRHSLRPSAARALIRCAERFGQLDDVAEAFDASALLLLSSPRTPRDAAQIALNRVRVDGSFISYRIAREIIAGCGGPLPLESQHSNREGS